MPASHASRKTRIPRDRPRDRTGRHVEPLESRTLLNATLTSAISPVTGVQNASPTTIDLTAHFNDPTIVGQAVVMHTTQGDIPLTLYNSQTPQTVANFLSYVNANNGGYNGSVLHRAIPGYILQGGSYYADQSAIPLLGPAVPSETGPSNTVGTIAAALTNAGPGSATTGWFINLGNNGPVLDGTQNGGPFTVFGTVIYGGLGVANRIANLPKGSVSPNFTPNNGDPSGGVLPLQNYNNGAITPANYVTIPSVQLVNPLAFNATSDNTAVVVPTISNGVLSLNYQPGQTGLANITVTATDLGYGTDAGVHIVSTSFEVAVGDVLGPGGAKQIRFTDADGTRATLSLTGPGNANVQFNGTVASESLSKAGIRTVTGTGLSISAIDLSGTSAATTLNVSGAGGNGLVEIDSIASAGDLRAINAIRGALSGDLTVAGSIGRIMLNSASGGTITVNGSGGSLTLAIPSAAGETLNSSEPIALLQTTSWVPPSGSLTPSALSAPAISRIAASREFDAELTAASVAAANVGTITNSIWTISGTLSALNAASISTFTINAGAVGRITDRGQASGLNVNSAGNVSSVSAASLVGSYLFAGQPTYPPVSPVDAVYPSLPTGFTSNASIGTVRVGAGGFSSSQIGAASLGNLTLGTIATTPGGTVFGVAAHQISLLTATIDGKRLTLRRPASQSDVTAALAKAGITLNNLGIDIA